MMDFIISELQSLHNRIFKAEPLGGRRAYGADAPTSGAAADTPYSNTGGIDKDKPSNTAIIDWVSFTVRRTNLYVLADIANMRDESFVPFVVSDVLNWVFGFGITSKVSRSGKWGYLNSWSCGDDDVVYGIAASGNEHDTVTVSINGTGCMAAMDGWEARLHEVLTMIDGKITRIDVAKDFYEGQYTPEQAFEDWQRGLFDNRGHTPKIKRDGYDWDNHDGSGKTLYVGVRGSSYKFTRIYEKGKQLGIKDSEWVRFEIEFTPQRRYPVPLKILLNPAAYWGGAYPICEDWESESCRFECQKKVLQATIIEKVENARRQVGKLVNFLDELEMFTANQILDMIRDKSNLIPRVFLPARWNCSDLDAEFLETPKGLAALGLFNDYKSTDDLADIPF